VGSVGRPYIHETEREHVLGALRLLLRDAEVLDGTDRDGGHRHLVDAVGVQRGVLGRIARVAGLVDVPRREGVLVQNERAALGDRVQIRAERRRVHRHQDVGMVSRRHDVGGGELDLEGRDAVHGARRGADLCGEVRERGQVVAEDRRGTGESVAGQLHPVAGIAGEADDDVVAFFDRLAHRAVARRPLAPSGGISRIGCRRMTHLA
jgi:hypothetical protein